jgi:hypothetical protein
VADNDSGWVDRTVAEVIAGHRHVVAKLPFVLIGSVDSTTGAAVVEMPWAAERCLENPRWALSKDPLVISGAHLIQVLDEYELFTGFDEVWIASRLPIPAPPDGVYLAAPRNLGDRIPPDIARWMGVAGCRLGLGDGDGTNWVATDLRLARALEFVG